jgi:hypothetical protein
VRELLSLIGRALAAAFDDSDEEVSGARQTTATNVLYRTRDGSADYAFTIEQQADGTYRAYVAYQPDYGNRTTDGHSTHRYQAPDGRKFICWSKSIRSEQDALRVSAAWADATQEYIKSGKRF